jgi:hypothetical protein
VPDRDELGPRFPGGEADLQDSELQIPRLRWIRGISCEPPSSI